MIAKLKKRHQDKRVADQMSAFYAWRPSGPGR
jgi:hypothetical protein